MKRQQPPVKNLMLVDDNEIDNFINQKMIESVDLGENIFVFSGGKAAFEYLQNMIRNKGARFIPELIFLDIDMPIMDGFQFLENCQEFGKQLENMKVIILSTSINPHDIEKAEQHKMVLKFVNKPLTGEFLEQLKQELAAEMA